MAEDFKCFNVAAQSGIADSSLAYTGACSRCAPGKPALHAGDYGKLLCDLHVLVYSRHAAGESFWILLNFTDQPRQFRPSDLRGAIILSTALDRWRLLMRSSLCARMKASSSKWMGEMPGVKSHAAVTTVRWSPRKASVLILVYAVNRYVRSSGAPGQCGAFRLKRFPAWMWRNTDIAVW